MSLSQSIQELNDVDPEGTKFERSILNVKRFFNMKDGKFDDSQKKDLRKMLQRYEGRELLDQEFRILQGILSSNMGHLDQKRIRKLEQQKQVSALKEKVIDKASAAVKEAT